MLVFVGSASVIVLIMSITIIFMRHHLKPHLKNVLMGGALFSLLGPPTGVIVFMIFDELGRAIGPYYLHANIFVYFKALLALIMFSYIIGSVPAAITGFFAGACRLRLNTFMMYLSVGLVGSVISFGYQMLILGQGLAEIQHEIDAGRFDQILLMSILPGFISGTVLAILFRPKSEIEHPVK